MDERTVKGGLIMDLKESRAKLKEQFKEDLDNSTEVVMPQSPLMYRKYIQWLEEQLIKKHDVMEHVIEANNEQNQWDVNIFDEYLVFKDRDLAEEHGEIEDETLIGTKYYLVKVEENYD